MIPLILAGASLAGAAINAYASSKQKTPQAAPQYNRFDPAQPSGAQQQAPAHSQLDDTQQQGSLMERAAAIPLPSPVQANRAGGIQDSSPVFASRVNQPQIQAQSSMAAMTPAINPLDEQITSNLYSGKYGY